MRKSLSFLTAAAVIAAATAAVAQPTPGEQRDMHIGSNITNGSSTIVTDQFGTHPDGFVGFSPINHAIADNTAPPREDRRWRHHRRHHRDAAGY